MTLNTARNLAAPAPKVEPAVASSNSAMAIAASEPATAAPAQPSEAPKVEAAAVVEPAVAGMNQVPKNLVHYNETPAASSPLSVSKLRGEHYNGSGSSDLPFEGYAAVLRGAPTKALFEKWLTWLCLKNERDFVSYGEAKRFVLIKGSCCFIYGFHTDPSPLYAIPLEEVYAIREDPHHLDPASVTVSPGPGDHHNRSPSHYVTILLKYKRDHSQAYQFTFDTRSSSSSHDSSSPHHSSCPSFCRLDPKSAAKRFLEAVQNNNAYSNGTASVLGRIVPAEEQEAAVVGRIIRNAQKAQPDI